jgi:hypothetical protein
MDERNGVGVGAPQGRDIACVVDGDSRERTEGKLVARRGEGAENFLQPSRGLAALADPSCPVAKEAIAHDRRTTIDINLKTVPYVFCRKNISWQPVLDVYVPTSFPIVSGWIPHGESAIGMRVDHKAGIPRTSSTSEPRLVARYVPALVFDGGVF